MNFWEGLVVLLIVLPWVAGEDGVASDVSFSLGVLDDLK